jgi:hypothetical protein
MPGLPPLLSAAPLAVRACQHEGKGEFDHACGYIVASHDNAGTLQRSPLIAAK